MNPLRPLTLLVVLALGLAACQDPQTNKQLPAPTPLEGVIVGALTDTSGATMPGQQVSLTKASDLTSASLQAQSARVTTTDEHGRFAFDVNAPGHYTLTTLSDTTGALARVTVTRGADGNLTAGAVELQAAALGAVTGSVAGQGAGVMVYLAGTSFLALTDADGEFAITRVPAGAYQAIASVSGIHSPARSVDVNAGASTAVVGALSLAPSIRSVTPDYLMLFRYPAPGDREFSIQGGGFGETQGASKLLHYGIEVPTHVITRWSNEEITVNAFALSRWFRQTIDTDLLKPVDLDRMVFRIETPGGAAASDIAGYYTTGVYLNESVIRFAVLPFNADEVPGLPLDVSVVNARLVDADGHPVTSPRSTVFDSPDDAYYLEPESNLPIIVTFAVDDPRFESSPSAPAVAQRPQLHLPFGYVFPGADGGIGGYLADSDGLLYSSLEDFRFRYEGYPESETVPDLYPADYMFYVQMPIPTSHTANMIGLQVLYRGTVVGTAHLSAAP